MIAAELAQLGARCAASQGVSTPSLTTLPPAASRALMEVARGAFAPMCQHSRSPSREPAQCDAGQCRIWLNDAQQEIDRLRRGADRVDFGAGAAKRPIPGAVDSREFDFSASITAAPTTYRRRSYAVAAIGDVSMLNPSQGPRMQARAVVSVPMVTNLGSVMDALT